MITTGDYITTTDTTITLPSFRDQIWTAWNDNSTSFTVNPTHADQIWKVWLDDSTSVTAAPDRAINEVIWTQWMDGRGQPLFRTRDIPPPPPQPVPKVPSRFEILKGKIQKRRQVQSARKKGRALLRSLCSDEQWKDYLRYGSIREVGQHAIYEIGCGWSGHIFEIGFDGEPKRKLCVHATDRDYERQREGHHWIAEDQVAAVLLALRFDEAATVAMANVHHFSEEEKRRVKARRGHKRRAS